MVVDRFLLKPDRKYEQTEKAFEPYDSNKEENPEARAAGKAVERKERAWMANRTNVIPAYSRTKFTISSPFEE